MVNERRSQSRLVRVFNYRPPRWVIVGVATLAGFLTGLINNHFGFLMRLVCYLALYAVGIATYWAIDRLLRPHTSARQRA